MKKITAKFAMVKNDPVMERLRWASCGTEEEILAFYGTAPTGLDAEAAEKSRDEYGENILTYGKKEPAAKRLFSAFINPFTVVLLALAAISVFTDILLAAPGDRNYATVSIITVMVAISGILRFVQETRSGSVADQLTGMIRTTACVEREGAKSEIPMEEVAEIGRAHV